MALVNENNEKIGKWINNKTTKIFLMWNYGTIYNCFKLSFKLANETRSYHYRIFKRVKNSLQHVGYAVPK